MALSQSPTGISGEENPREERAVTKAWRWDCLVDSASDKKGRGGSTVGEERRRGEERGCGGQITQMWDGGWGFRMWF